MTEIDFCYWDAKSQEDLIIIIINQTITATIGITAVLRMPTLFQLYEQRNTRISTLMLVHILVLLWSITQSIVNFYSIGVFLFQLGDEETATEMIEYSHTFAVICSFPGFIVQTLFLTICYKCCSNILKNEDISIFSKYSYKLKMVMLYYSVLRLFIHAAAIMLIVFSNNYDVGIYSKIQFISLIIDSSIIFAFLVGAARLLILKLNDQNLKTLKLEYFMMMVCSSIRIIIDIVFIAVNPHSHGKDICVSNFESHIIYSILYNIVSNFLMHFVPNTIILKIYQYGHLEDDLSLSHQKSSNLTSNSDGVKSLME